MVFVMEDAPLSKQAIARIQAARLEAGADLLNGLATFCRGDGMSSKELREHDPSELMPHFERHAEETVRCGGYRAACLLPDPEAYSKELILLPMKIAIADMPVHPQVHTVREAIERAHIGHGAAKSAPACTEPTPDSAPADAQKAQAHAEWSGVGTTAKRRLEIKVSNRHIYLKCKRMFGRGEWIRTTDLLVPNQAL